MYIKAEPFRCVWKLCSCLPYLSFRSFERIYIPSPTKHLRGLRMCIIHFWKSRFEHGIVWWIRSLITKQIRWVELLVGGEEELMHALVLKPTTHFISGCDVQQFPQFNMCESWLDCMVVRRDVRFVGKRPPGPGPEQALAVYEMQQILLMSSGCVDLTQTCKFHPKTKSGNVGYFDSYCSLPTSAGHHHEIFRQCFKIRTFFEAWHLKSRK